MSDFERATPQPRARAIRGWAPWLFARSIFKGHFGRKETIEQERVLTRRHLHFYIFHTMLPKLAGPALQYRGWRPGQDLLETRDAAHECQHHRLPGDRTTPFGCWDEEVQT